MLTYFSKLTKHMSTMNEQGKYYCPKCKKLVKGYTTGGSLPNGDHYWEITCEICNEILDED